ncbi:MAG: nucleotidyltransferase domain-containing protein [Candidatus Diapherotrites archaeon]|uniref:Nucleotidyltransferase domain-containing protein n=1 Tax=Candidatus Iainarchaeum sp. TaxID=3101447 RepID=A0A7J4JXS0_9ARCH|nr:nucleotidyltransferase domain-containing protein [Candidatus Diapherotrites archaeon]HIH21780.1 hypothetical protein [Candidatus Diapherotrites archaeon]HIH32779.1 hypothetical protein [Candidatus Diapherotrites archaeon]
MPHQVTPSRRKFRIAKLFVKELHKIFGEELKAAFIAGSVAANMALPESDIDLVLVYLRPHSSSDKSIENRKKARELESEFKRKLNAEINDSVLSQSEFENLQYLSTANSVLAADFKSIAEILSHGAVPIFGSKEYLQGLKGKAYNLPRFDGIKARGKYFESMKKRTMFKRSKKGRQRFFVR